MRFVDANVFIHAFLNLKPSEIQIKQAAKTILTRIEKGEKVATSVVHLSEVANVLESYLPFSTQIEFFSSILASENAKVLEVNQNSYLLAVEFTQEHNLGVNDSLAVILMLQNNLKEIYSFDKGYDSISGITRLTI